MRYHAKRRLKERFNMTIEEFQLKYEKSVKNGHYFKKEYQNPHYTANISVCVRIGGFLMVACLYKKTGEIHTVFAASEYDWRCAEKYDWYNALSPPKWLTKNN